MQVESWNTRNKTRPEHNKVLDFSKDRKKSHARRKGCLAGTEKQTNGDHKGKSPSGGEKRGRLFKVRGGKYSNQQQGSTFFRISRKEIKSTES